MFITVIVYLEEKNIMEWIYHKSYLRVQSYEIGFTADKDGDKHSIRKKDMPNREDLYSLTICQFYIKELPKRKIWQKQKKYAHEL